MQAERRAALDAILDSGARKKLIVAGPGTGKTYTFKAALERAGGGVALTFIRALVRDLGVALADTAEIAVGADEFSVVCQSLPRTDPQSA